MKTLRLTIAGIGLFLLMAIPATAGMIYMQVIERLNTDDMQVLDSSVTLMQDLELLVFQVRVRGSAGRTIPTKRGQLDGAPVLGQVCANGCTRSNRIPGSRWKNRCPKILLFT
jgi:hypothetical protein